jgi:hypothetical protein
MIGVIVKMLDEGTGFETTESAKSDRNQFKVMTYFPCAINLNKD